jgi:hypothetical protein
MDDLTLEEWEDLGMVEDLIRRREREAEMQSIMQSIMPNLMRR